MGVRRQRCACSRLRPCAAPAGPGRTWRWVKALKPSEPLPARRQVQPSARIPVGHLAEALFEAGPFRRGANRCRPNSQTRSGTRPAHVRRFTWPRAAEGVELALSLAQHELKAARRRFHPRRAPPGAWPAPNGSTKRAFTMAKGAGRGHARRAAFLSRHGHRGEIGTCGRRGPSFSSTRRRLCATAPSLRTAATSERRSRLQHQRRPALRRHSRKARHTFVPPPGINATGRWNRPNIKPNPQELTRP